MLRPSLHFHSHLAPDERVSTIALEEIGASEKHTVAIEGKITDRYVEVVAAANVEDDEPTDPDPVRKELTLDFAFAKMR